MKRFLFLPCLALCACMQQPQPAVYYPPSTAPNTAYAAQPAAPVYKAETPGTIIVEAPSYQMRPAAYDDSYVMQQREGELLAKERALLKAQEELYNREKKVANMEVDFYSKSKTLAQKEERVSQITNSSLPIYVQKGEPVSYTTTSRPANRYEEPEYGFSDASDADCVSVPERMVESPDYIIMQHPLQRDLVRCPVSDDVCLQSYERLGYIRARNLSRFTAQDEVTSSGYPGGKWRENNTIPRW